MNLLIRTYSSNDEYNADIAYVFIKVTPELARVILKRAKAFKKLSADDFSALEMAYSDRNALYVSDGAGESVTSLANERHSLRDNEYAEVAADLDGGWGDGEVVECCRMMIDEDTVEFSAIPKHTDVTITTHRVPLSVFEKAIK